MSKREARTDRRILERESEIASLLDVFAASSSGDGAVAIVEGPAGVGKTALLEEAKGQAAGRGVEILTARGVETEQEFSFGVVLQLLQRRVLKADVAEREDVLSGAASLAAPLLEGRELVGAGGVEAAFAQQHGLYWVVANLAERGPLVLVVDDAHWADAASMRFLATLVDRLNGLAVSLVLAHRLGEEGVATETIDAIARDPSTSVVSVGNLSRQAVFRLVRAAYDVGAEDAFCEACYEAVRGNPLYLRELLNELSIREVPADEAGAERVHEMDVEALGRSVRSRLNRLGPAATSLAEAASVGDGGVLVRQVARLADVELKDAAELASTLTNADILEPGEPVRFVHPLVQRAVYSSILDAKRRTLHLQIAEILRDDGADPERIAGHLLAADPQRSDWAIGSLVASARRAVERGAPETAVLHLTHALAGVGRSEDRGPIVSFLGLSGLASGDPRAAEFVSEALASMAAGSERALYHMLASETLFAARRFPEALGHAKASLAEVDEDEDEQTAGHVIAYLAALSSVTRLSDAESIRRLPALSDRLSASRATADTPPERLVAGVFAGGIGLSGERSAAESKALAIRALRSATSEELRGAMFQAPMALSLADAFDETERFFGIIAETARRLGLQYIYASALGARSDARYREGRLREAIPDAETAIETARGTWPELQARATLALCLLDYGDPEGAERAVHLDEPERWLGATHLAIHHESRGHLLLARQRTQDALDAFTAAGEVATSANAVNPAFCAWRSGAALAHGALGHRDEALELATQELELAERFGAKRAIGIALRAHGLVEGGRSGVDRLERAAEILGRSGARLENARALTDLGAALRRAGATSAARDRLRQAMDLAARCDAKGLLRRARDEIVAAGGKPRRERMTGPSALTPQERRIAELVVAGRSNREIAQALFLTRKTIETHLTNAYAKLGIQSRDQLADQLREDSA